MKLHTSWVGWLILAMTLQIFGRVGWLTAQPVKNLHECPHGVIDGALGKCLQCSRGWGLGNQDDDCQSARAALYAKIAENTISQAVGPYDADDVARLDCASAKLAARAYTGWKDARERRAAADRAIARTIDGEREALRKNSALRQFDSQSWQEQREDLLTTEPNDLKAQEATLKKQAEALERQAAEAQQRGDH